MKRAYDKKKLFRLWCKQQVKAGKMPNAEGTWVPAFGRMGEMLRAGHRA
jgi:hypothetical protein